ncbi:hypothetical protein AN958_03515 [Leucoagaricus sp. SymC.cos]|nr:hypothetical protein AN958_03515 [Leucoagaricus sp. SymC.cos]
MTSQQLRDEELDLVSGELDQLDDEYLSLLTKRAKMRARLNGIRAPTSFLTTELLSFIFQYACFLPCLIDEDDPHLPIILSSVSTHWREVAHSVPSLWSQITVNVNHPCHASANTLSLLRLYLDNAGKHSLSLRITVLSEDEEADDDDEDDDQTMRDAGDQFPIEDLLGLILEKRETITTLILEELPIDTCMQMLKQCPNLIHYRCRKVHLPSEFESRLEAPLVFEHMRTFGWTFGLCRWDNALIAQVELPAIQRFICEPRCGKDTGRTSTSVASSELCAIQREFWPKLTTLKVLERKSNHCTITNADELFNCLPSSLEELRLSDVSVPEHRQICRLLTYGNGQQDLFPRLNTLVMIGSFLEDLHYWMADYPALLVVMLQSRREGGEERWRNFSRLDCLYLGPKPRQSKSEKQRKHKLTLSQRAKLQKFVDGGMRLITADSDGAETVWKESEPIDSLAPSDT